MKTDGTALRTGAKDLVKSQGPLVTLVVLCAVGLLFPAFRNPVNAANILGQVSPTGLVSIGMAFVILSGGIDLSVGSIVALTSILAVHLSDRFGPAALLVPILVGIAIGWLNGVLVTRGRMPPFIATLATMLGVRGLAFIVAAACSGADDTAQPTNVPEWFSEIDAGDVFGIPYPAIFFILALVMAVVVSKYTSFGRSVYAVGGSEEAAKMMGLSVNKCKMLVYMICGGCAGAAGLLFASRVTAMRPDAAVGWELIAIAAVVISGTALTGGVGKIGHTIYGVLILGIIPNLINHLINDEGFVRLLKSLLPTEALPSSIPPWYNEMITGALLLAVVLLQWRMQRRDS